jgi:hypothetical protein
MFFLIRSVRRGVTYGRWGQPINRSEHPLEFWLSIICMSFIGAVFFLFFILMCSHGGTLMP